MDVRKKKRGRKPALAQKVQQSSLTSLLPKRPAQDASGGIRPTTLANPLQGKQVPFIASVEDTATPVPVSATDLEIDPNSDRRKRRKTVSPSPNAVSLQENDWEAQLRMAAYGNGYMDQMGNLVSQQEEPQHSPLPQTPKAAALEPYAEHGLKNVRSVEVGTATETTKPKTPSPPKKVLKLRKDGKLGSPKTRQVTTPEKRKRGRPAKISPPKTKIVTFKYGKDDESRILMGRKIEQLFLRPAGASQVQVVVGRQTTPQPPKATHPFFLAKPVTKNESDTASRVTGSSKPSQENSKASPRKNASAQSDKPERAWPTFASKASSAVSKYPGSKDPPWPSSDNFHVQGELENVSLRLPPASLLDTIQRPQKLKATEVRFTKTVLDPWTEAVEHLQQEQTLWEATFTRMQRRLATGSQLQGLVAQRLSRGPPLSGETTRQQDEIDELQATANSEGRDSSCHYAIERLYKALPTSSSAFDHFQCESHSWADKYAPLCTAEVLQQGKEVFLLRDWLQRLTVSAVEAGNVEIKKDVAVSRIVKKSRLKRRRKRAEHLDGFVISSDEEANELDELIDPNEDSAPESAFAIMKKSVMRSGDFSMAIGKYGEPKKDSHAAVISGPHGCGKTAAVHAVARELDFEVFEINPGTRRSGKDLMDKVGDMTRNHLVQRNTKSNGTEGSSKTTPPAEPDEVGQNKLQAFLMPKTLSKKASKTSLQETKVASERTETSTKPPKVQKQSLILLEEVDILFEEDKHFWSTVLELIAQSKRPIIMTCSDESRLPLEELPLHAIFRLKPPPEQLLIDYVLLIAASEGHLLRHDELSKLCHMKHNDLRASIHELNIWCQMGVGDKKGGLEWMPIPSESVSYTTPEGRLLRVISDDTYREDLSNTELGPSMEVLGSTHFESTRPCDEFQSHRGSPISLSDAAKNVGMRQADSKGALAMQLDRLQLLCQAADAMSVSDLCLVPNDDNGYKVSILLPFLPVLY